MGLRRMCARTKMCVCSRLAPGYTPGRWGGDKNTQHKHTSGGGRNRERSLPHDAVNATGAKNSGKAGDCCPAPWSHAAAGHARPSADWLRLRLEEAAASSLTALISRSGQFSLFSLHQGANSLRCCSLIKRAQWPNLINWQKTHTHRIHI